jgi:hypothetical protein
MLTSSSFIYQMDWDDIDLRLAALWRQREDIYCFERAGEESLVFGQWGFFGFAVSDLDEQVAGVGVDSPGDVFDVVGQHLCAVLVDDGYQRSAEDVRSVGVDFTVSEGDLGGCPAAAVPQRVDEREQRLDVVGR